MSSKNITPSGVHYGGDHKDITKVKAWVLASRPKTLPAALVPVIVGSAAAYSHGANSFNILYSVVALLCSILIQIGTNFTNDLYDHLKGADTKERKGPLRVIASGLISVKEMKWGVFITFLLAFLLGMILVAKAGVMVFVIGVLSIIAGLAYTAGPYPLAYNGLGDLFVFMFFGVVGTAGTYYVQTEQFTLFPLLCSLPVGALITNILVVNNYRDIEEDRTANKMTLAVKLGRTFARFQYLFLLLISYLVPIVLYFNSLNNAGQNDISDGMIHSPNVFNHLPDAGLWILLPLLTLPLAIKLVKMLYTLQGTELNKTLELTAKFSAIFGLLFAVGILL